MTCLLLLFQIFFILHLSVCQNLHEETKNIINSSSSMGNLTKLLQIEDELLKNLNVFAKQMQKKLNMIKLWVQQKNQEWKHINWYWNKFFQLPTNATPFSNAQHCR